MGNKHTKHTNTHHTTWIRQDPREKKQKTTLTKTTHNTPHNTKKHNNTIQDEGLNLNGYRHSTKKDHPLRKFSTHTPPNTIIITFQYWIKQNTKWIKTNNYPQIQP